MSLDTEDRGYLQTKDESKTGTEERMDGLASHKQNGNRKNKKGTKTDARQERKQN